MLWKPFVYARHNTKHVVVNGVHAHLSAQHRAHSVVAQSQLQHGIVNAAEVAASAGLVLLRLQCEAVDVDTHSRHVGVVLVRLHQVEVLALTLAEAVMAVQLDLGGHSGVVASQTLHAGHAVAALQHSAVEPVAVVEGLLSLPGVDDSILAAHEAVALHNPHQLLHGVVEVQLDLVGAACHALATSELQLLDQVLVGDLCEAAALISVQVDVVHIQRCAHQASGGHAVADGVCAGAAGGVVPAQVAQLVELQPDLHLVVLQSNQGQCQTRVAAEPELQRNVQSVLRSTLAHLGAGVGLGVADAVSIAVLTTLHQQVHQLRHVAHHLGVASLLAGLLAQLIPDVQPVTVVLVDLLTTDLNVHVVDQVVAHPVQPAELCSAAIAALQHHLGQCCLQVHAVDQIAVTADGALHLLAEVGAAVEGLLNGLHGEVSVATVDDLEDKDIPSLSGYFWSWKLVPFLALLASRASPRDWTIT